MFDTCMQLDLVARPTEYLARSIHLTFAQHFVQFVGVSSSSQLMGRRRFSHGRI
jgi:hypothetical protein